MIKFFLLFLIFAVFAFAQLPEFEFKGKIKSGNKAISLGQTHSPCVADWDGDGKKDLLVGYLGPYLYLYKNTGTNANPTFRSSERMQAGGRVISVSNG